VIASFDAAHLPPTDYYVCVEKYARQMAKNAHTPFIHSLCTWWAQSSLVRALRSLQLAGWLCANWFAGAAPVPQGCLTVQPPPNCSTASVWPM
jgi:hypothetical protein